MGTVGHRRRSMLATGLVWALAAPTLAQAPQDARPGREQINLAPDDTAARPVVELVNALFAALARRDEAAVLALYEPPPVGLSADQVPRYLEARRFMVWKHLKRGALSKHRFGPIQTGTGNRGLPTNHFSVTVESEADRDLGPRLQQTRQSISSFHVRLHPDGRYRLISMDLQQ